MLANSKIRVVNAFRSGIDRQRPAPQALLRRANQIKSQSLDASGSHSNLSNIPASSASSSGFGRNQGQNIGVSGSIYHAGSGATVTTTSSSSSVRQNQPAHQPAQQSTLATNSSNSPASYLMSHNVYPRQQPGSLNAYNAGNGGSGSATSSGGSGGSANKMPHRDHTIDALQDDQIEALLRSETSEALEEELDDFDTNTESLVAGFSESFATTTPTAEPSTKTYQPTTSHSRHHHHHRPPTSSITNTVINAAAVAAGAARSNDNSLNNGDKPLVGDRKHVVLASMEKSITDSQTSLETSV